MWRPRAASWVVRDLYRALYAALGLIWPISVLAANQTFGAAMAQIDMLGVLMTLMLASLSGLTALLSHMKKDYEAHGKIDRLWLYVASKMAGSNLAGLLVYFYAPEKYGLSPGGTATTIIVAAFGGTWLLERALTMLGTAINSKGN
jgi:hypothetical protein